MTQPARVSPGKDQIVIIADGDKENATHVERQLRRAGIVNPVATFLNGDDLHSYLATAAQKAEAKPCLMFLDPRMPGANGYDPVRWVRREKSLNDLEVVVFSANDQPDEIESASELGVHLFLKKHPDAGSLAKIVGHFPGAQPLEAWATREHQTVLPK